MAIELMGVDLFHTGNELVKSTPLKQVVHRSIGTQTETDESPKHSITQKFPPERATG